jgi:F-type H+-transporting ATPase subunit delta
VSQAAVRQYANALYDVARARERVDSIGGDLSAVAALVAAHADLRGAFEAPLVPVVKKRALVDAVLEAGGGVAPEVHRLLVMLADRDRLVLVGGIASAFHQRVMASGRRIAADVVTAEPLSGDGERGLAQALAQATGLQVTLQTSVDPAIIGGLIARVGSIVFDASVAGQLARLRHRLLGDA